jgi:hypothetical protein
VLEYVTVPSAADEAIAIKEGWALFSCRKETELTWATRWRVNFPCMVDYSRRTERGDARWAEGLSLDRVEIRTGPDLWTEIPRNATSRMSTGAGESP